MEGVEALRQDALEGLYELDPDLGGEIVEVGEPAGLFAERLRHGGVTVTQVHHHGARAGVEKPVSIRVPDHGAASLDHGQFRPQRPGGVAGRQEVLISFEHGAGDRPGYFRDEFRKLDAVRGDGWIGHGAAPALVVSLMPLSVSGFMSSNRPNRRPGEC